MASRYASGPRLAAPFRAASLRRSGPLVAAPLRAACRAPSLPLVAAAFRAAALRASGLRARAALRACSLRLRRASSVSVIVPPAGSTPLAPQPLEHPRPPRPPHGVTVSTGRRALGPLVRRASRRPPGVREREHAQRGGQAGTVGRGLRDLVDQGGEAQLAAVRHLLEVVPELGLQLERGPDRADPHRLVGHHRLVQSRSGIISPAPRPSRPRGCAGGSRRPCGRPPSAPPGSSLPA